MLFTIGHGTLEPERFAALLRAAGVEHLVDVRSAPGSRRNPQFARQEMERWLPEAGIAYSWERRLGGFRKTGPESVNTGLRHPAFRGYADYMQTEDFRIALDELLAAAAERPTAVMCSESLWWRCHRRLLADAVTVSRDRKVVHLTHDGSRAEHRVTDVARRDGDRVVYPAAD